MTRHAGRRRAVSEVDGDGMTALAPGAAGGRRRAALLRLGTAAREARITAEDLARLEQERAPNARAELAAKFGRLFDELCRGGAQRALADAVLRLLARDLAKEVRQALAEAVAESDALPHDVARALAGDDIKVARPILENSPVLTDADLLDVLRVNSLQYALAVAGRQHVSELVAAALVDTGSDAVVARLVGNSGARLSQATLERVMAECGEVAEVRAGLVRRPELPVELVERLVAMVGDRLERQLVQSRRMAAPEARIVMSAVRDRATVSLAAARSHADATLRQRLATRLACGGLGHEELLHFLREGDVAALETGLGLHAGLEPAIVRRLLYDPDRRHLAALCLAAGFSNANYLALRLALELAETAVAARAGGEAAYKPETVRFLQHQYESLRDDPARRDALLGLPAG